MADSKHSDHEKQRAFLAAVYEDLTKAANMVKADPDCVHYRSSVGETVFHYLIIESELRLAETLLGWGSDINTQDDFGDTPLIAATTCGHISNVRWLIDHGATVEPKNSVGETVLVYAAMNERAGIYQYLMSLPRQQPIDFYFDDFSADRIFRNDDLVMRSHLIGLGLSRRFECE